VWPYYVVLRSHLRSNYSIAGGEKYVAHGILFKFCLDRLIRTDPPEWFYGGPERRDEYGAKSLKCFGKD